MIKSWSDDVDAYRRGYNDALAEVIRQNSTPPKLYHLTEQQGKAVHRRY